MNLLNEFVLDETPCIFPQSFGIVQIFGWNDAGNLIPIEEYPSEPRRLRDSDVGEVDHVRLHATISLLGITTKLTAADVGEDTYFWLNSAVTF